MIEFKPLALSQKEEYDALLAMSGKQGCEYSFVNLYLWGRQQAAKVGSDLVIFSQYNRKTVYLFPVGPEDKKKTLDAIIADAAKRGIPCRLAGLSQDDYALLERLYPGQFSIHFDRDSFDYVYKIDDLADLSGRKYQKKRNHLNRFRSEHPDHRLEPMTDENLPLVRTLTARWYEARLAEDPLGDFQLEQAALERAFRHFRELELEGILLWDGDQLLAMAIGSFLNPATFDIHFEKALERTDGTYAAINQGFAAWLRKKYPELVYLNREDDMGIEGLRKAKLSYCPDHMVEKCWGLMRDDR
jgi:hypothetical protein